MSYDVGDKPLNVSPLSNIDEGKTVKIVKIVGGRGLIKRLYEIGLLPGAEIQVLRNSKHGPVIIRNNVSGTFSLGFGVAKKIMVEVM
ncbi:MAG: ferrous iron transport protein A [Thaumarchaeota archaeon]|jgi:ferrous iron transport protein A|nr:ferrous iron transport protein A [Candidatus Geocrenenecus arthurdayi]MCL7391444.1 ferrous iron transport protein A [Candidatus Geocrenenecus arthurdayi]MCL7395990.1 ferrous iron transport protein A [Candidatus Geocrenenecus arthurdayi]MCL7403945.1 ferrous iron transport protein A [Candidatus Geocrenenecus arthurdayi]